MTNASACGIIKATGTEGDADLGAKSPVPVIRCGLTVKTEYGRTLSRGGYRNPSGSHSPKEPPRVGVFFMEKRRKISEL